MKNKGVQAIGIYSVLLMLSGCVSAKFTKTGVYIPEKLAADCAISVYTSTPKDNYQEVGFISFRGGAVGISTAKKLSSEYVCVNGGNAILLIGATDHGAFNSATVLRIEPAKK